MDGTGRPRSSSDFTAERKSRGSERKTSETSAKRSLFLTQLNVFFQDARISLRCLQSRAERTPTVPWLSCAWLVAFLLWPVLPPVTSTITNTFTTFKSYAMWQLLPLLAQRRQTVVERRHWTCLRATSGPIDLARKKPGYHYAGTTWHTAAMHAAVIWADDLKYKENPLGHEVKESHGTNSGVLYKKNWRKAKSRK